METLVRHREKEALRFRRCGCRPGTAIEEGDLAKEVARSDGLIVRPPRSMRTVPDTMMKK